MLDKKLLIIVLLSDDPYSVILYMKMYSILNNVHYRIFICNIFKELGSYKL